MIKNFSFFSLLFLGLVVSSCNNDKAPKVSEEEGFTLGTAKIVVDESLYPIVDEEHEIFKSRYKRAHIDVIYKPFKESLALFLEDSIDIAIFPRKLTPEEQKAFDYKKIILKSQKFATDGVALITGNNNPDSLITKAELIDMLQGKSSKNKIIVFDSPKSSTVEYLMALASVNNFPKDKVYSLNSNEEVIRYVNNNPNAIGILGVSWIKRPDQNLAPLVEKVKLMAVKGEDGDYVLPTQNSLKIGTYPLLRELYIIDGQGKYGLGQGFSAFLAGELGQRIILKSGIAPDSLPSRQIMIRN